MINSTRRVATRRVRRRVAPERSRDEDEDETNVSTGVDGRELANEGFARRRVTTGDEACRRLDSLEGVA